MTITNSYEEIQEHQVSQDLIIMILGNKLDICNENPSLKTVSSENAIQYAQQNNFLYQEISAKNLENFDYSFEKFLKV